MKKNFLAIDLGLKGAIALIDENSEIISCTPIPTIEVLVNKKKRNQYDINEIFNIIKGYSNTVVISGMERLRAMPRQSSQTAFSMGGSSMLFKTIFTILNIPFIEMEPRKWQQAVFKPMGIQYDNSTTKQASIQAAKQLFPNFDFKRTERCSTISSDMTDSCLIAYYLKNNYSNI